ncbi:zona pellucida-like domain protein [Ancylostoma caninum]|uniref:Zona pellucida-like domain protein n=1 Tax=Ancylostoma caninum TaxID=29170 RepID=A0A368H600_ANCCA|nr:zona pellucida-like domain protein [Ancylostoma caninum]
MHIRSFAGGFFPQQPRIPQYPRGPQIPAALFYPRSGPGFIPPQANNRQQWFVPPNAAPYWEAPGPIPPQGAYGPTTSTASTHEPMKPSVNPENYDGTIPTQPSANPELFTTANSVSPVTDLVQPHPTRGWYNPTSTVSQHLTETTTTAGDEGVDKTSPMMSIFDSETNPFTTSSTALSSEMTSPTTEPSSSATSSAPTGSTVLVIEDITKGWFDEETATSPQSSHATESTYRGEETTAGTLYSLTTAELPDDIYDHTDVIQDMQESTTSAASKPNELEQAKANYFPRPISSQVYQPPGHLPEDFTQHIDVNFLKPNRTCTGPLCGIDADKVSLYNPGKGDGRKGPTLLISNAAKGDAARLGYIPPSPKLISEFTPPPTSTEYYIQKLVPGGPVYPPAEVPGPFPKGEFTTIEPYRAEIPKGPHVFMPPQNFPAPPSPTLVPPAMQTAETTTVPSYSPTAKTIAPPTTTEYVTLYTTAEVTTTSPAPTTPILNTLPPFETTAKTSEIPTEAYTVPTTSQPSTETQPPQEGVYTTPPEGPVPWSPTYKTVPPSPTTTLRTEAPYITPTTPRTTEWTPPSEAPSTPSEGTTAATTEYIPTYKTPSTTEGVPVETTIPTEAKTPEVTTPGTTSEKPTETTTALSTTASTTSSEATTAGVVYTSEVTEVPTAELSRTTPAITTASTTEYITITSSEEPIGLDGSHLGKVHVICKEEGIEFIATTLFPFTGQIFANERKRVPSCLHNIVGAVSPKVFLPFAECGVKNAGEQADNRAQYHMQVVVVIQQQDGTSTVQSFMAQCVHQKIQYNKQTLPRRIEEALEELRLVATKLEQKAPLPQVEMKIVVDEHHKIGPEVSEVDIGMPLAVQWKLLPESDAYGFHVKNCIVKDDISNIEHKMIDELGCSTDLSIFAHPHYDTYHDTASSHLWAFKVPDHTRLRIRCDVAICSDIPSSTTNISSCASIPTHSPLQPPFCPDLITSPSNSILYDAEGAFLKRRRQTGPEMTQSVRATLCTGDTCDPQPLGENIPTMMLARHDSFVDSFVTVAV